MKLALALVVGGYAAGMLALAARLARRPPPPSAPDVWPSVSVVVAARDEAPRVGRCLAALLAQDYPGPLEVVVADDHSADGTADVVRRAAVGAARPVRVVRVPDPTGALCGKALALDAAIATSAAEVVLITDADCAPEAGWARALAAALADGRTGLACGLAGVEVRPGHAFDRVQALDWALLLGATAALAELGLTTTGMGTSMGLRREVYAALGGYPALPVSVTEDFTLVRAVAERTPWRVRFVRAPRAGVWTLPCATPAETFRQRKRWARGGLSGGPGVWAAYAGLFAVHALPLAALAVAPGAAAAALAAKTLGDAALLAAQARPASGRRRVGGALARVATYELWLFSYLCTLPVALVLQPRIRWKGRQHGSRPFGRLVSPRT